MKHFKATLIAILVVALTACGQTKPKPTAATLPNPVAGEMRTSENVMEFYDGSRWRAISGSVAIASSGSSGLSWGSTAVICMSGGICSSFQGQNADGIPAEYRSKEGGAKLNEIKASAAVLHASDIPKSYLRLAKSIKLDNATTDEVRIKSALAEMQSKVFDFVKVDSYLYHSALKLGANYRWVWKPMRQADLDASHEIAQRNWLRDIPNVGIYFERLYAHEIPERVLARVAAILEKVPDATFLISDYEVIKPDPFLAVTTPRLMAAGKIWIVDVWNEPTFDDNNFENLIESVHSAIQFGSVVQ